MLTAFILLSLSARRAWIEIKSSFEEVSKYVVALRKESVDRNTIISQTVSEIIGSLSARRAWIEIWLFGLLCAFTSVALRKESVDRNNICVYHTTKNKQSLSARRAWIEIVHDFKLEENIQSRSPQGERG